MLVACGAGDGGDPHGGPEWVIVDVAVTPSSWICWLSSAREFGIASDRQSDRGVGTPA
jgi:hypothetical protein